jgi:hypothetical protein
MGNVDNLGAQGSNMQNEVADSVLLFGLGIDQTNGVCFS